MKNIAVIGAGIMGTGIAQCLLMAGYKVEIVDNNSEALDKSIKNINSRLQNALEKALIDTDDLKQITQSIKGYTDLNEISPKSDLIIEAASENIDIKKEIFETLEKHCYKETVFATNTSCLSINKLAETINRKEKFIGMHFFYPAERNKLLEIVASDHTSADTIYTLNTLADTIDKIAIIVKDTPGFCVNRFFVPVLNEATRLLENNKYKDEIYTINHAIKEAFRSPFGPFEIMNLTGTSLAYHASNELYEELGEFYKPSELLKSKAENNTCWQLATVNEENDEQAISSKYFNEIKKHFQGLVMALCVNLVGEKIASITDINLGARVGLGWKMAPFDLMNDLGPSKVYRYVEDISKKYKSIETPDILDETDFWDLETVSYSVNKNVANIIMRRPEALNALSENLFRELNKYIDSALADENIDVITLSGYPKVFSAGADVKFFISNLEKEELEPIFDYTEIAHKVLDKITNSPKPVIALIDGIAYGGGLELALCCHFLVATKRSSFQFPETSIGLFPGFGGTYRLPKRTGVELARYLILFGPLIKPKQALAYGLIDNIVTSRIELQETVSKISTITKRSNDYITKKFKQSAQIDEETEKILKLTRDINLLLGKKLISKRAKRLSDELESRSLNAINISLELINASKKLSYDELNQLEYKYVKEIFKQPDLLEKFKAVFKK